MDSQQNLDQESIIGWALQNPDAFFPISNRMKDWHFQSQLHSKLWKKLLDVYTQHHRFPALGEAHAVVSSITGLEPETQTHLLQILNKAYTSDVSSVTGERVANWVADREISELSVKMTALVQGDAPGVDRGGELDNWIQRLEAIRQLQTTKRLGSVFEPLDPKIIADPNKAVDTMYAGDPQPTGYSRIDDRLRDKGLRGHSTIIFGPTGGGKTALTLNIAINCLRRGGRVVWITLDDDPGEISERIYSHMICKPFKSQHYSDPEWAGKQVAAAAPNYPGHFWGEHILPSTHTPQDVIRELLNLQRHFFVKDKHDTYYDCPVPGQIDLVVIDTADQIRSHRHYQKEWYELEKSFEELARICPLLHCPVILTAQAGQEGMGASQLTLRNIAGSFGKNKAAKLIIACAQTYHQIHNKKSILWSSPQVHSNLHRYHSMGASQANDNSTLWEPFWACILKNTRGSDDIYNHVRYIKLPMLAHHASCRIVEDWEEQEELITADRKTQREEKEATTVIPGQESSPPELGVKRGVK